ncbi:hypothetical protein HII31_07693 [Pseudocercospora fuligena]|uniref:Uncharacterized protein n=1 Tax=Pseudocercospora fuligena TaxID=685502 RepID=A0A8H6RJ56_9PEZI|nr:hypothetical protein HII31_07693 [Pseudocercospora fuligena]
MWRNANWHYEGEEPTQKPPNCVLPRNPRAAVTSWENPLITTSRVHAVIDTHVTKKRKPTDDPATTSPPSKKSKKLNTIARHHRTLRAHALLNNFTHKQNHTTKEGKAAELLTSITVKQSTHYASIREFTVNFHIRLLHRPRKVKAGYIRAFTIDRSPTSTWVKDLLEPLVKGHKPGQRTMVHHDPDSYPNVEEIHMMMQNIYHKDGTVREEFEAHAEELEKETLHFIGEFEVTPQHRGHGVAQKCLQTYISLLPTLSGGVEYDGSVTLSPAGFLNVRLAMMRKNQNVGSWSEVENKLVRSYIKSGFEVWCKSDPKFARQGGITIMGRQKWGENEVFSADKTAEQTTSVAVTEATPAEPQPLPLRAKTPVPVEPPSKTPEPVTWTPIPAPPQAQVFEPEVPELPSMPIPSALPELQELPGAFHKGSSLPLSQGETETSQRQCTTM